jgi:transposase
LNGGSSPQLDDRFHESCHKRGIPLSFFAVGRALGLHHQTVQRCVERAVAEGPIAALDDRPRPGREPTITLEAKAWLVSPACRKAKDLGYPHELWTTRLLARHGPAQGHACLANLAQGAVCKILDQEEVKPHKVRSDAASASRVRARA